MDFISWQRAEAKRVHEETVIRRELADEVSDIDGLQARELFRFEV